MACLCWICGDNATTGEHKLKRTDITKKFPGITQQRPAFVHFPGRPNKRVGSAKADVLKSKALICAACNGARTQPYDNAWTTMSDALDGLLAGPLRRSIYGRQIFPYDTRKSLRNVHHYFAKLTGQLIVEGSWQDATLVPLIQPLADCVLHRKPHPDLYLSIGHMRRGIDSAGVSNLFTQPEQAGPSIRARWIYFSKPWAVEVLISNHRPTMKCLGAWHPSDPTTKLAVARFHLDGSGGRLRPIRLKPEEALRGNGAPG